jgi:phosphoribosylanthranilate isomerase
MSLFKIKICGVRFPEDVVATIDAGADAIGLNFYSPSVRSVSIEQAVELTHVIRTQRMDWPGKIVGVFVNHSADQIASTVHAAGLEIIQLHGDERPNFIAEVRIELTRKSIDPTTPIIRAVRVAKDLDLAAGQNELLAEVSAWQQADASMVLLDAAVPGSFGGTGTLLDWHALADVQLPLPVALAGGLNPDNVADAIAIASPTSVDVASGVENAQHQKNDQLISRFVAAAKKAFHRSQ